MLCSLFCIMVLHVGFCKSFIHDTNIVHSCLEWKKLHKQKCWFCGGFSPKHGLVLGVWSLHKVVKREKNPKEGLWFLTWALLVIFIFPFVSHYFLSLSLFLLFVCVCASDNGSNSAITSPLLRALSSWLVFDGRDYKKKAWGHMAFSHSWW